MKLSSECARLVAHANLISRHTLNLNYSIENREQQSKGEKKTFRKHDKTVSKSLAFVCIELRVQSSTFNRFNVLTVNKHFYAYTYMNDNDAIIDENIINIQVQYQCVPSLRIMTKSHDNNNNNNS